MPKLPPVPKTFTSVIAERKLRVEAAGMKRTLRIEIGAPIEDVPTVSGLDWRCPIRFSGHSAYRRTLQAYGVDSLQSLAHALFLVRVQLTAIEREPGVRLSWIGGTSHGLPGIELALPPPDTA